MRKGGGKGKGSGFEREIAKKIVKSFKKFEIKQRECWRSVLSGGHIISAGDLYMSDRLMKLFPYAVECKFYRRVDWWHFLMPYHKKRKTWKEWQWLGQAVEGAAKIKGLKPILIIKANHGPTIVVSPPRPSESGWTYRLLDEFLKDAVREAEVRELKD
jgi:hypothetical protein